MRNLCHTGDTYAHPHPYTYYHTDAHVDLYADAYAACNAHVYAYAAFGAYGHTHAHVSFWWVGIGTWKGPCQRGCPGLGSGHPLPLMEAIPFDLRREHTSMRIYPFRVQPALWKFTLAFLVLAALWRCGSPIPQTTVVPAGPASTPTPSAYPVDIPAAGIRVWVPPTWQAWVPEKMEETEPISQIYVVPVSEEDDEEAALVTAPLPMEDAFGFEPPYILFAGYPLPENRAFRGREVYFALEEIALPLGAEIAVGAIEPVRTPRGRGWTAPLTLTMPDGQVYEGRITLVLSSYGMVMVAVGLAPQGEWPSFEEAYWEMVYNVSFSQPPPTPTPSS